MSTRANQTSTSNKYLTSIPTRNPAAKHPLSNHLQPHRIVTHLQVSAAVAPSHLILELDRLRREIDGAAAVSTCEKKHTGQHHSSAFADRGTQTPPKRPEMGSKPQPAMKSQESDLNPKGL